MIQRLVCSLLPLCLLPLSLPAGHHIYEGRWLADPHYLNDYTSFWLGKNGDPRRYSFWVADAVWQRYCVTGDKKLPLDLLPNLIANYKCKRRLKSAAGGSCV